jgi:hypothetical protein
MITLDKMQTQLDAIAEAQGKLLAAINSLSDVDTRRISCCPEGSPCKILDAINQQNDLLAKGLIFSLNEIGNALRAEMRQNYTRILERFPVAHHRSSKALDRILKPDKHRIR